MIKFEDSEITQIIPDNIKNQYEVQALSYAIGNTIKKLVKYANLTNTYAYIDNMPENILDIMATESRTQYYDESLDLDTKRKLIKNTLVWYLHAGTPSAVEELVTEVFGEGTVKEWFEYGGEPYRFKIVTNGLMTEDTNNFFTRMIKKVKNTRSHIEAIEINRTIEQPLKAGSGTQTIYKMPAVVEGYYVERDVHGESFTGAATKSKLYRVSVTEQEGYNATAI